MKLTEIYIRDFGPLVDMHLGATIPLSPKINLILGPNEAGKTQIKKFIGEMFFQSAARSQKRSILPNGYILFRHDNVGYRISAESNGRTSEIELRDDANSVVNGLTELFPVLKNAGGEVFNNLYSFGLDELIQGSTMRDGPLSEHLFGAIASGKGMPISSILNEIDSRLRRITGRSAKVRSLGLVISEIIKIRADIKGLRDQEYEFSEELNRKEQIEAKRLKLKIDAVELKSQEALLTAALEMKSDYHDYLESTFFVNDNAQFEPITTDLLADLILKSAMLREVTRDLENDSKRANDIRSEIIKVKSMIADIDPLGVALVEKSFNDVTEIRKKMDLKQFEIAACESDLSSTTSIAKGDLTEAVNSLQEPKIPLDVLATRTSELENDLRDFDRRTRGGNFPTNLKMAELEDKRSSLLRKISACEPVSKELKSVTFGSVGQIATTLLGLILALVVVSIGLSLKGVIGPIFGEAALIIFILSVLSFIALLNRNRSRVLFGGIDSEAFKSIGSSLGFEDITLSDIPQVRNILQGELVKLDESIAYVRELDGFRSALSGVGIVDSENYGVGEMRSIISTFNDCIELHSNINQLKRDLKILQSKFNDAAQRLVYAVSKLNFAIDVHELSWMEVIELQIQKLNEQLEIDKRYMTRIDILKQELDGIEISLSELQQKRDSITDFLVPPLNDIGCSLEDLDESLLERLRMFQDFRRKNEIFNSRMKFKFGDDVERAFSLINLAEIELYQQLEVVHDEQSDLAQQLESVIQAQADLRTLEMHLRETNSISIRESDYESKIVESTDLLSEAKTYALAFNLLTNANKRFEEVHQPELLKLTSEIFSRITSNRYLSVFRKNEGTDPFLTVRSSSGIELRDIDLSRGAREQLFMAIRFALITRTDSLELPILMDDVMVNADISRAEGLARELTLVSNSRQIFYFCARSDALDLFEAVGETDINVIELAQLS